MRDWRLAAVGAAVLAVVGALSLVIANDDGDDVASVTMRTSTSTSTSLPGTSITVGAATTPASPSTTAARVRATASTAKASAGPAPCLPPAPGSDFDGFGAAEIVIDNSEGSHRSCVLTADTPPRQEQGLMRQDDLGGYDGMIFRFATEEERWFWMRNTSIPLSIAFFSASGAFVSATDMEPCGDSPDCPHYTSRGPTKFALEVIQGRLRAVGATADSRYIG